MSRAETVDVLHVDDEPGFAEMAAQLLERENEDFAVRTATSASEGLDVVDDAAVDCVVSDYEMPGQNGIEFLEAVREDHPDLPFILFTGKGSEEIASDAISAGVTDYLQKEGGTDQYAILANRIENAVDAYRTEREHQRHLEAIETAQEGISILDEDGCFRYVNEAYADLYRYDPEEMVGEHWSLVYRDEDVEDIEAEILPVVRERGKWHGTTTGLRADGTTFVEDHVLATTANGELVCTVRNVSDERGRERAIEELHDATRAVMGATTAEEVADAAVEAARDVLGMAANAVHLYDEETDSLPPVAWTEYGEELVDEVPTFERGDGIAWDVFETGEFAVYDDVSTVPERYESDTSVRSELLLPLGDHGLFITGSAETGDFDGTDVSLARTLAAHVTTALDRIERESELREERNFFEQSLNALDELFYVVDPEGDLTRWNDSVRTVTGYDDEELDGMPATELFPADQQEAVGDAIAETLSTGRTTVEAELRTAGGDRIPYEFTGARLTDTEGDVLGLAGIGRDVTAREEHERRLKALHAFATDLMTCDDAEGICERTIEAAESVLEFDLSVVNLASDGQLPIAATSTSVPPDGAEPMSVEEGLIGKAYRTGESLLVDDARDHPDANPQGPYRAALTVPIGDHGVFQTVSETPGAFDESDRELAKLLVSHAETALTRLDREQELREKNERLDEFVSIVSHDLRNPLNVAEGHVDILREEFDSEHLDALDRAHDRMEALIRDLLALSREGESTLDVTTVDLHSAVTDAWRTVATADATLDAEVSGSLRADRFRLRQLLENLFRNAVEHGGEDVTVTVGDLPDGFYVADDGPGIPAEERDEVFEAGYSTTASGTGFGLRIVEKVANTHGWDVAATESEAGGARVEVTGVGR